jgi:hypothetical protein
MMALAGVAFGDPAHGIAWTVVFSLVLGFAGATQDVTIDGWRAGRQAIDHDSLFGGGLSRRHARCRRRHAHRRRPLRLAHGLSRVLLPHQLCHGLTNSPTRPDTPFTRATGKESGRPVPRASSWARIILPLRQRQFSRLPSSARGYARGH